MAIRLNADNSKIINDKVFITALKAHTLKPELKQEYLNQGSKANHPKLGSLIEYTGPYTRK